MNQLNELHSLSMHISKVMVFCVIVTTQTQLDYSSSWLLYTYACSNLNQLLSYIAWCMVVQWIKSWNFNLLFIEVILMYMLSYFNERTEWHIIFIHALPCHSLRVYCKHYPQIWHTKIYTLNRVFVYLQMELKVNAHYSACISNLKRYIWIYSI